MIIPIDTISFLPIKKTKLILIIKQSSLSLFDFVILVKQKEIEVALAEKTPSIIILKFQYSN